MKRSKEAVVLVLVCCLFLYVARASVVRSLQASKSGWRADPAKMISKIIFSFFTGQGVFWLIGYDQLGLFMNPKVQLGLGQKVADSVYGRIPHTATTAWVVKVIEILTDAGKGPIEGAVYRRHGFAPDVVATALTQPFWSTIEAAEKTTGALLHPELVNQPEQVRLSLGCIYGSIFRYFQAAFYWLTGGIIYRSFGRPIETRLSRLAAAG